MYSPVDKRTGYLFATNELGAMLDSQIYQLKQEVEQLESNRFLNTAPDDLKKYFVEKYSNSPIELLRDSWYATTSETQVDVRYDRMRWIEDKSRPALVPGERVDVHIPFRGDAQLFYARPSSFTSGPPRAVVENGELILRFESPSDAPQDVRPLVDQTLAEIGRYLGWQHTMICAHNDGLASTAEAAIQSRRQRLLAQAHRASALGIPVRARDNAPKTYAIPTVRKAAAPKLPSASDAPFAPEPAWANEQYEHALKVMQDMALVFERSPATFKTMNEEALRQHFLVQLNGQFEGKATGETFNMAGKTDILLREGERNVFIGECKFWSGPKGFSAAIDQLLSYATWRDSKTAILVFNRDVRMETVLVAIQEVSQKHANFKRALSWPHESGFRYIFHANGDQSRELVVTVLVFYVPT
jgi:hypothetical protein